MATGYIEDSLSVDASFSFRGTGYLEYRGVLTGTKEEVFRVKYLTSPDEQMTNIGEFLALVNGLAWLKEQGWKIPIYSDSVTARAWARDKKTNSDPKVTEKSPWIRGLLQQAEEWVKNNPDHSEILEWDTAKWGEIPADFDRK